MAEGIVKKLLAGKEVSIEEAIGKPVQNTGKIPYLPKFAIIAGYNAERRTLVFKQGPTYRPQNLWVQDPKPVKVLTGKKGRELMEAMTQYESTIPLSAKIWPVNVEIGADPEIFVVNKKNEVIPAWTFLKDKPKANPEDISAYWDGFQAEFTCGHTSCIAYVLDNIRAGLFKVYNALPKGGKLSNQSVLRVDPETLATAADKYVEFGCMPSKNAYGLKGELAEARMTPIRFAGGHIHFGYYHAADRPRTDDHTNEVVKMLDRVIGIPSVLMFQSMDQPIRRQFYGLPGEYRTPPHGLEYRTLSNAWLCHPTIACLVLEIARTGLFAGYHRQLDAWKGTDQEVIDIIQSGDVAKAKAMMEANKNTWLQIVSVKGPLRGETADFIYNKLPEGVEALCKNPENIANNWRLNDHWEKHSEGDNIHIIRAIKTWLAGKKV